MSALSAGDAVHVRPKPFDAVVREVRDDALVVEVPNGRGGTTVRVCPKTSHVFEPNVALPTDVGVEFWGRTAASVYPRLFRVEKGKRGFGYVEVRSGIFYGRLSAQVIRLRVVPAPEEQQP